jgi:hypothetical protein
MAVIARTLRRIKMALKKKGTPEKIEVVVKEADLQRFRKLIEKSIGDDIIILKTPKEDKK